MTLSMSEEEDGRREYSDEQFLTAVREHGPLVTAEVAEEVGCSRRQAYNRLSELEQSEEVSSRKVGNTLLWTLVDE